MLSVMKVFTTCVLLIFGAPALSGKHVEGTEFGEPVLALDSGQASLTSSDRLQAEEEKVQEMTVEDQLRTKEDRKTNIKKLSIKLIENDGAELKNQFQTNLKKYYIKVLNLPGLTKKQKNHTSELEEKLPANAKEENVPPSFRKELNDRFPISTKEGHEIEVNDKLLVKVQGSRKKEHEDQLLIDFEESTRRKLQDQVLVPIRANFEKDPKEDATLLWTRMVTSETKPNKGPILGFKKRSFQRKVSNFLTKTKSTLSIGRRASRKQSMSGQETPTSRKESVSAGSNSLTPTTISKPESPQRNTQKPPYKPTKRGPYEGFCVADEIKNIVMIPGSGEFVYDTKIQQKIPGKRGPGNKVTTNGPGHTLNENNDKEMSDAMLSLKQLKEDLPKIEWVSVVVNWFGDSVNINECEVYPAVEFNDGFIVTPDDWQVGYLKRNKARLISRDSNGNPRYGGTVSDGALIRYVDELHSRGYKVMLYPMLVLDTENKEWRGRMTGQPHEIGTFFRDKYNPFINHYSFLARQTKVDGFIIGSEFVGLTRIRDRNGNHPAVLELAKLAQQVKSNLGSEVTVTYAADWNEYGIAAGGWYPMDELWASEYIDVVGINAYFPLTDDTEPAGGYTVEDGKLGWITGEGYYYFYDYTKKPPKLMWFPDNDSKWAWKNIEKWWSEPHSNPDKTSTPWEPKMKKIWFTEFGFPSVDACTNEPYIFIDNNSPEKRYPRYSNKQVSFKSQQVAIEGTLKKWKNSEVVEKMFLYAWDARPFPYFPLKTDVWGDGVNWETGPWVQGKIGRILGDRRESVIFARRSMVLPQHSPSATGVLRRRKSTDKRSGSFSIGPGKEWTVVEGPTAFQRGET